MIMIAIGTVIVCIPLALLVRHRPEDYGYLPDGDTIVVEKSESGKDKQCEPQYANRRDIVSKSTVCSQPNPDS